MAFTHVNFNDALRHGSMLRQALNNLEHGLDQLNDAFAAMIQMKDGDGSQAAHFTEVQVKFGFESTAKAKEGYDELNSLQAKLNANTSVTDLNAALLQAFAKFR